MIKITAQQIADEYGISKRSVERFSQKNKALKDVSGFFELIRELEERKAKKEQ